MPVELQASLFARILTFERTLAERAPTELVIGIVYQAGFTASRTTMERLRAAWRSVRVDLPGRPVIRVVPMAWESPQQFAAALDVHGIDALYIAPLRAVDPLAILDAARTRGKMTLTGTPELVSAGASVGLRLRGDKPVILVNPGAAALAGATFGSQLLHLAEIVQ